VLIDVDVWVGILGVVVAWLFASTYELLSWRQGDAPWPPLNRRGDRDEREVAEPAPAARVAGLESVAPVPPEPVAAPSEDGEEAPLAEASEVPPAAETESASAEPAPGLADARDAERSVTALTEDEQTKASATAGPASELDDAGAMPPPIDAAEVTQARETVPPTRSFPPPRVVPPPPPREREPAVAVPRSPVQPHRDGRVATFTPRQSAPVEWNLWDLERVAREDTPSAPERAQEWSYLFLYLRQFARPGGTLPTEFDALVRESFEPLLGRVERA
jgi:hypothetical protein